MNNVGLTGMLDEERERQARAAGPHKPETPDQRERRLAKGRWRKNVNSVWYHAHLLSDDELEWFLSIAAGKSSARADDAIQLETLTRLLRKRASEREARRRLEDRRQVAAKLRRLRQPVPAYFAVAEDASRAGWRENG
jgi:hypothetical protein